MLVIVFGLLIRSITFSKSDRSIWCVYVEDRPFTWTNELKNCDGRTHTISDWLIIFLLLFNECVFSSVCGWTHGVKFQSNWMQTVLLCIVVIAVTMIAVIFKTKFRFISLSVCALYLCKLKKKKADNFKPRKFAALARTDTHTLYLFFRSFKCRSSGVTKIARNGGIEWWILNARIYKRALKQQLQPKSKQKTWKIHPQLMHDQHRG